MKHDTSWKQERWRDGLRLLRQGEYWEAHEAWEELWQALPRGSSERRATKALIQIAAICHKPVQTLRGRPPKNMQRGMAGLIATCAKHLETALTLEPPHPDWEIPRAQEMVEDLGHVLHQWQGGDSLDRVCRKVQALAAIFAEDL